eukprot:3876073-Pyramimonas_sp.AAC.1
MDTIVQICSPRLRHFRCFEHFQNTLNQQGRKICIGSNNARVPHGPTEKILAFALPEHGRTELGLIRGVPRPTVIPPEAPGP